MSTRGDRAAEEERLKAELDFRRREVEVLEMQASTERQELAIKKQEADVKDREQRLKNRELRLKIIELKKSRFTNPVFLAIIGTSATALSAVFSVWWTSESQANLERLKVVSQADIERFKADSTLILELTKAGGDEKKARDNLTFLVESKLITNDARRNEIKRYLDSKKPVPSGASFGSQGFSATCAMTKDFDLPQIVSDLEKALRANQTVSELKIATSADLATLAVAFTVPNAGFACPSGGPRVGRVTVIMQKTNRSLRIDFDVPIPRLLWAAFSPDITGDVVANLTKMFEGKLGAGNVKCV